MSFCTCGLTVSGTGSVRAGTGAPPLLAVWASAELWNANAANPPSSKARIVCDPVIDVLP
jgi:hypothetical protein